MQTVFVVLIILILHLTLIKFYTAFLFKKSVF